MLIETKLEKMFKEKNFKYCISSYFLVLRQNLSAVLSPDKGRKKKVMKTEIYLCCFRTQTH